MSILSLLFSFKGRIKRGQYWLAGLLMPILAGVLFGIYVAIIGSSLSPEYVKSLKPGSSELQSLYPVIIPFVLILVMVLWSGAAIYTKRLHDRNKGAIWLLAIYGPALGSLIMPFLLVLSVISMIWVFIELGCMRGTDGPNRFDGGNKAAYLDDVFGRTQSQSSKTEPVSPKSYGGMEAAMAAVAEAARANSAHQGQMRTHTSAPPKFGQRAPAQFGRLNSGPNSGGFGRRV
jgi:uncharacterized membrane protein YhaH (DUF805 family)